jgi:hypothetical protein
MRPIFSSSASQQGSSPRCCDFAEGMVRASVGGGIDPPDAVWRIESEHDMTTKHLRITYWIVTLLFASLQAWSALSYLVEAPRMTATITDLGYPIYFMKLLGVAKLCGIAAILYGGFPTLKEWAYAGFTFDTVGAFWSHAAHGDGVLIASVPLVFLAVQLVSYFLWKRLSALPAESRAAARVPAPPGSSPQSRPRIA